MTSKNQEIRERFEGFIIQRPKWEALWKIIDGYDTKHAEKNYPYQLAEIELVLKKTEQLLAITTRTSYSEFYLKCIKDICDVITHTKTKSKDCLINQLKNTVHHLCFYGFPHAKARKDPSASLLYNKENQILK